MALRLESHIARIAAPFFRNAKPSDFMPWPRSEEPEATPESLLLLFKSLASETKKRSKQ